jgi:hypothetical protein
MKVARILICVIAGIVCLVSAGTNKPFDASAWFFLAGLYFYAAESRV